MLYKIQKLDLATRKAFARVLYGIDLLEEPIADKVITAWATTVAASEYPTLDKVPWDAADIKYTLLEHVNEVTKAGLNFAKFAAEQWNHVVDYDVLIQILILHDVDHRCLRPRAGRPTTANCSLTIPHGVVGGMLLKELDFPDRVISTVTTHSPRMPFPGNTFEGYVLHYADHFCCDNALFMTRLRYTTSRYTFT